MILRSTCRRSIISGRVYFKLNDDKLYSSCHSPSPPTTSARLTARSLIALHGIDVPHFLQGITTNNISTSQTSGFYSAFLTAQGRVLHDVFIYPTAHSVQYTSRLPAKLDKQDPAYLIEVDSEEQSTLIKHIKKYKIRAKLDVRPLECEEWNAWSLWNGKDGWSPTLPKGDKHPVFNAEIGAVDTRAPGMGYRSILPYDSKLSDKTPSHSALDLAAKAYRVRRYLRGVPEGQREILRETALPAESNIDYMGGIDFRKGCYVGQELTIRTHHTGVVRKRILPVQLYSANGGSPPETLGFEESGVQVPTAAAEANISKVGSEKKGRSAGKWLDGVGNLGLALCRLETMTDTVLTGERGQWSPDQEFTIQWESSEEGEGGEVKVKAFIPAWHKHRGVLGNKE
ncbi:MAG: ccr4 associated factor [Candelina submexicana]|nr:MAG: ccr4 associated factor [Candelina submexicana]